MKGMWHLPIESTSDQGEADENQGCPFADGIWCLVCWEPTLSKEVELIWNDLYHKNKGIGVPKPRSCLNSSSLTIGTRLS